MTKIIERIERELGQPGLAAALAERLKPSDLQSLWLEVSRRQAAALGPADVLTRYAHNRFVRPSRADPVRLLAWEQRLQAHLPADFTLLELSPVCPLGTNSAVAGVAQNWAVATERHTEVVSDATNVLALEAAARRKQARTAGTPDAPEVHLAAGHRLLRAQQYAAADLVPHFRLFGLCSAGRGAAFAAGALARQVACLVQALRSGLPADFTLRLALSDFGQPARPAEETGAWLERLRQGFPGLACEVAPGRTEGRGYYRGYCFHLFLRSGTGPESQIADGGAVDWAARLLSDSRESMVISGLGTERLATACAPAEPAP